MGTREEGEVLAPWRGFERWGMTVGGIKALCVRPRRPLPGAPWVWRSYFFDAFPSVDAALVERGFHLAWCDVDDLFGNEEAVRRFDVFHRYAAETLGLAKRPVLEGFSRGGLPVYAWAERNPEKVRAIYCDAPVLDIGSWPGGRGRRPKVEAEWEKCLRAWGMTEEESASWRGPLDGLAPLAEAGVPIIHVVGQVDEAVPVEENTDILERRYTALGGSVTVIRKEGVGHHPHSLEDPAPIVDFILAAWHVPR